MTKAYYTLFVRQGGPRWSPEFGDHDRDLVAFERQSYRDAGVRASDLKIIKTGSRQADVMAALATLNAGG